MLFLNRRLDIILKYKIMKLIIILAIIFVSTEQNDSISCNDSKGIDCDPEVNKVNVGVYFEALSSESRDFVLKQLYPAFISDPPPSIMSINLVPFGNARMDNSTKNVTFTCENGQQECEGNMIQSCAFVKFSIADSLALINCMFASPHWQTPRISGAEQLSQCVDSEEGIAIEYKMGEQTMSLNPPHTSIPWITIDGQHKEVYDNVPGYLSELVCLAYQDDIQYFFTCLIMTIRDHGIICIAKSSRSTFDFHPTAILMNENEVKDHGIVNVNYEKTKVILFTTGGKLIVDGVKAGKQIFKWYYDNNLLSRWFADTHQITFVVTDSEDYEIIPPGVEKKQGWFPNIFVSAGLYRNTSEYIFFDEAFGILDDAYISGLFRSSPGMQNAFRRLSRNSRDGRINWSEIPNFFLAGQSAGYFNAMNRVLQMLRDAYSRNNINRSDLERLANLARNIQIGRRDMIDRHGRNADSGHIAAANFWDNYVARINHIINDISTCIDHLSL